MSQHWQGITPAQSTTDAQRSFGRGVTEHLPNAPLQNIQRVQANPPPVNHQTSILSDDVHWSDETRQALMGRNFADTQEVTPLKDALQSLMHEGCGDEEDESFTRSQYARHNDDQTLG